MPSRVVPSAAIRFRVNECESWLRDSARRSGAVARASAARSRCTTRRKRAANGRWAPSTPSRRHALPADWPSRRSPRGEAGGPMRPWLSLPRAGSNSTRDRRSRRTSATRRRSSLSSTSTEPSLYAMWRSISRWNGHSNGDGRSAASARCSATPAGAAWSTPTRSRICGCAAPSVARTSTCRRAQRSKRSRVRA